MKWALTLGMGGQDRKEGEWRVGVGGEGRNRNEGLEWDLCEG